MSATLIVRDEARHLGSCLQTLRGLVDEVVVVDTGSIDDTRDVARSHGARLVEAAWRDDFAAARNIAVDHARGSWILYIDADERVVRARGVRRALASMPDDAVAGLVRFRAQSGFTRYWTCRLFRRLPGIRFRGVIHESPHADIFERVERRGANVVETELAIDHLGYDGDRTGKYHRDLPLLMRALRHDPDRLYLWYALGAAHLGLGDDSQAARAWTRGVEILKAKQGSPGSGLLLLAALASFYLDQGIPAPSIVGVASARYPDHTLSWWLQAWEAVVQRKHGDAVPILLRLAARDPEHITDPLIPMDARIFGECAYELLGTCLLRQGDPAGATRWLRMAEEANGGVHSGITIKRSLAEAQLARVGA